MPVCTDSSPTFRFASPSASTVPMRSVKRWTSAMRSFLIETKLSCEASASSRHRLGCAAVCDIGQHDPQEVAFRRIHGCFAQLCGHHFAKPFETTDIHFAAA